MWKGNNVHKENEDTLEKAISDNSAQKDKTLLTLSAAAIGLALPFKASYPISHPNFFIWAMFGFLTCILAVLMLIASLRRHDHRTGGCLRSSLIRYGGSDG